MPSLNPTTGKLIPPRMPAATTATLIVAATLVLLNLNCRIRLLAVPLERDEGGFAYIGQQMLHGIPPFKSAYSFKLMGTDAAYALIMAIFGQTAVAIHTGLLLVNLGNIVLLYFLARCILPVAGAVTSAGVYALLAVSMDFFGVFAHATHFVTLFALAGLLALFKARESGRLLFFLLSGFCLGAAITMKQNGIFFCLLALLMLCGDLYRQKIPLRSAAGRIGLWSSGVFIPYAIILLYLSWHGVFSQFWFWTVTYALEYASGSTLKESLVWFRYNFAFVTQSTLPLWGISLAGLAVALSGKNMPGNRGFLLLFFVFSFLSVTPGGYFYPHYFVLLLPALSIFVGVAFHFLAGTARQGMKPWFALAVIVAASIAVLNNGKNYLFLLKPKEVSRLIYDLNPFAEASMEIASYIKNNSTATDKVAIIGSEPQILFYAQRESATKHLYVYTLTDNQPFTSAMRQEMFNEIIAHCPKLIVVSMQESSWLADLKRIGSLIAPLQPFFEENYRVAGIVDILPSGINSYIWGESAQKAAPITFTPIYVLKRSDG